MKYILQAPGNSIRSMSPIRAPPKPTIVDSESSDLPQSITTDPFTPLSSANASFSLPPPLPTSRQPEALSIANLPQKRPFPSASSLNANGSRKNAISPPVSGFPARKQAGSLFKHSASSRPDQSLVNGHNPPNIGALPPRHLPHGTQTHGKATLARPTHDRQQQPAAHSHIPADRALGQSTGSLPNTFSAVTSNAKNTGFLTDNHSAATAKHHVQQTAFQPAADIAPPSAGPYDPPATDRAPNNQNKSIFKAQTTAEHPPARAELSHNSHNPSSASQDHVTRGKASPHGVVIRTFSLDFDQPEETGNVLPPFMTGSPRLGIRAGHGTTTNSAAEEPTADQSDVAERGIETMAFLKPSSVHKVPKLSAHLSPSASRDKVTLRLGLVSAAGKAPHEQDGHETGYTEHDSIHSELGGDVEASPLRPATGIRPSAQVISSTATAAALLRSPPSPSHAATPESRSVLAASPGASCGELLEQGDTWPPQGSKPLVISPRYLASPPRLANSETAEAFRKKQHSGDRFRQGDDLLELRPWLPGMKYVFEFYNLVD